MSDTKREHEDNRPAAAAAGFRVRNRLKRDCHPARG